MPSLESIYYGLAIAGAIFAGAYTVGRSVVFVVIAVYKFKQGETIWPVKRKGEVEVSDEVDAKIGRTAERSTIRLRDMEKHLQEHRTDDLRRFERGSQETAVLRKEMNDGFGEIKQMIGNVEGQLKILTRKL